MLCRYPALWHRIFEHWAPLSCILTYCHVNHPFCNVTCLVYIHLNFWRVIAELSSRSHWFSCWLSAQDVAQCCSFQLAELSMEHNLCTIANQIAHSDSLSALLRLRLHQLISAPSEVLGLSGGGLRLHNCRPSSKDSSETQCFNLHNSTRHQAIIYIYLLCDRFSIVFHHRSYGPTGAPMTDALIFFSPGSLRWSNLSFEPEDRSPPSVENDAHRHGTTVSKANGLASLLKFVAGKKCAEDIFGPTDQCSGRLSKETLHSGIYIFLYTTYVHTCIIHIYIYVYICRYIYISIYFHDTHMTSISMYICISMTYMLYVLCLYLWNSGSSVWNPAGCAFQSLRRWDTCAVDLWQIGPGLTWFFCNDSTAASREFRETTKRQRTWLDWLFTWISKHFHHFGICLFRGIGIDGDTIAAVRCSWCHSAICQSRLKDLQRSHLIQRGCTLHSLHAKRCLFCKQMEFALLVLFSCSTQKPRQHTTITYMYT